MSAQQERGFRRLGDVIDFDERLAAADAARRRYRAQMTAEFGWAPDVTCATCGDTGRVPVATAPPCFCDAGRALAENEARADLWASRCPRRFRDFSLDTHPNPSAVADVRAWLTGGVAAGENLLMMGTVGTGKTGLAMGAMRALFLRGRTVLYKTVPDLLDSMRPKRDGDTHDLVSMRNLQRVHCLLLDDLGAEKPTEWAQEQLYMIVNERYLQERPTIVTTNLTMPQLEARIGERIISRLTESAALVEVLGPDLRRSRSS